MTPAGKVSVVGLPAIRTEGQTAMSNRARRSSVFNSFLSWRTTPNATRGSISNASGTSTPRKASAPLPPILSSGMTSEADRSRPSVVDDIFIHEEDAKVGLENKVEEEGEEEEEEEEGDEFSACRGTNV